MAVSLTSSWFGNFSKRYSISIPNCKTNAWTLSSMVPIPKMRTFLVKCFRVPADISLDYPSEKSMAITNLVTN
jgi:hypothetical protein